MNPTNKTFYKMGLAETKYYINENDDIETYTVFDKFRALSCLSCWCCKDSVNDEENVFFLFKRRNICMMSNASRIKISGTPQLKIYNQN